MARISARFGALSRVADVVAFAAVFSALVYSAFAAPGSAPPRQVDTNWESGQSVSWTPHPTSTDPDPLNQVVVGNIEKQHLFVSRVRVRSPEFEGVYTVNLEDKVVYLRGGSADIALHAGTRLIDVYPRGRYFISEAGVGESSDWRLSYEDMPLFLRNEGRHRGQVCIRPWNWFQLTRDRDNFLSREIGDSDYHEYLWPKSWRLAMNAQSYPDVQDADLITAYNTERKPYAFGSDRDVLYMATSTTVLLRDVIAHDDDMPDPSNISSLCGTKADWRRYADNSLYMDYLESEPGKYQWKLVGMSFDWVYPAYDGQFVSYAEQPRGKVEMGADMFLVDEWPEMERPSDGDSSNIYDFMVMDLQDSEEHRVFDELPANMVGDVDDLYGDGEIAIDRSSVNSADVCREFTVDINTIEYTPSYIAAGVEAHCVGVGANYNHMSLLIKDWQVASLHPHMRGVQPDCIADGGKAAVTRECVDLNIGIEGRVMQRKNVQVFLFYRVYEQVYDEVVGDWEELTDRADMLVVTNDPDYEDDADAFDSSVITLEYEEPFSGVSTCDYYADTRSSLFESRPDDRYVGTLKADIPLSHRVSDPTERRKRFGVFLDVDMVHHVEIGGTGPGLDYRIHDGPHDDPSCSVRENQITTGDWNPSGRPLCPDGTENCQLWMGPPAEWKHFDIFRPTVTPTPVPTATPTP